MTQHRKAFFLLYVCVMYSDSKFSKFNKQNTNYFFFSIELDLEEDAEKRKTIK